MNSTNREVGSPETSFIVDVRSGQPQVAVLLFDGVEETEAVASIDILRRAGVAVTTIKCSCESNEVTTQHGIIMRAENCFDQAEGDVFDAVVVPGGDRHRSLAIQACDEATKFIIRHYEKKKIIASCCTGIPLLSQLGILKNHRITVHSMFKEEVEAKEKLDDAVVIDDHVLTSKGLATILEFNLALIEMLMGRDQRENVETDILVD
ncbi:hypothetical protein GEMRC1_000233 [Eukaryota sp. GEM-RC1]